MTDADLAHKIQIASFRRQTRQATSRANQLVPEGTVAGNALTVVIAIMSFLACLTLGAVTLVRDASRDWQLDIQREVTIQVRPIDGVDLDTEAAKAAAIARKTPGVAGRRGARRQGRTPSCSNRGWAPASTSPTCRSRASLS